MAGVVFCCGMPLSPWQALQSCAFCSTVWASADAGASASPAASMAAPQALWRAVARIVTGLCIGALLHHEGRDQQIPSL